MPLECIVLIFPGESSWCKWQKQSFFGVEVRTASGKVLSSTNITSDLALEGVMVKLIPTGPWGWDGKIISDIFCHVTSQGKAMKFHVRLGALSLLTSWSHPTFRCHTVEDQPLWHSPCFMPTERSSARLRKHKNSQHVSLYSFSVEEAGKSDISDLHFSRFSTRSVITVISDKYKLLKKGHC